MRRPGRVAAAVLPACALLAFALGRDAIGGDAPAAKAPTPAPATPPAKRLGAPELRDQFESARKALHKATNALGGHDAGRVSLLLQRADEEVMRFEDGSGLADYVREAGAARDAATRKDLPAAEQSLRRARAAASSLIDYTVARQAEVAYRSALGAVGDGNTDDFLAALDRMEESTRAPLLLARLRDARAAIARARTAMVRNDFPGGRKEVAAAHSALDALIYIGALSRACYGLLAASELLHDRASLTAKDQIQRSLHDVARALDVAPEADREDLAAVHDQTVEVWRRMSHPLAGDAAELAAASGRLETIRQRQR